MVRDSLANRLAVTSTRSFTRQLRPLLAEIPAAERALAELGADMERKFVALGESLQRLSEFSHRLVENSNALIALTGRDDARDDAVRGAVEFVQHTFVAIKECSRETHELVNRLDHYHAQTGRLLEAEQQIERILAPLRIIQRLFRIESVVLTAEMQAGFDALSSEIPRFEEEVRATFARHAATLAETRQRIAATAAHLRQRMARQDCAGEADRVRIAASLAAFQAESVRARERDQRLAGVMREIDAAAQRLVVSLQYQDITRQKMEHVAAVLRELGGEFEVRSALRDRVRVARLHQTCRLEAQQVQAIEQELAHVLDGIAAGVNGTRDQLARIDADCWGPAELKAITAAVAERAAGLHAILREVRELIPLALANADEAMGVVDGFGHLAANVATHARAMAESMRLIALNAQVLAAQAGERGAGLLVLAERTYAISEEVKRTTENISHEFSQTAGQLQAVTKQCEALKSRAQDCRREIEAGAAPAGHRLDVQRDETVQVLQALGGLLEEFRAHIDEMLRTAACKEAGCGALARLREFIDRIAAACEPAIRFGAGPAAAGLDRFQHLYTMDSERHVHAAALGGACAAANPLSSASVAVAPAPEPPAEPASVAAPSASFGDNIELF